MSNQTPKPTKGKSLHFTVTQELHRDIKVAAAQAGIPLKEALRRAVAYAVENAAAVLNQ